jgi:ribosomal protein L7Ae-like RNA K-turn-binding protein
LTANRLFEDSFERGKSAAGFVSPWSDGEEKAVARESIISSLSLVTKSGTFSLGIAQTLKSLRTGTAKLVFFANNIALMHKSLAVIKERHVDIVSVRLMANVNHLITLH